MTQTFHHPYAHSELPPHWFVTEAESREEKKSSYKGWVFRNHRRCKGEIPCLIFPI